MRRKGDITRRPAQLARDRRIIAQMYFQRKDQYEIAEITGLSQSTISNDIKALIKEWQKSALIDIDKMKAEELARINNLEREYIEAWEKSKKEKKTVSKKQREKAEVESNAKIEQSVGDPRYLAGVQWCIGKRSEILGINAPDKHEHSGPGGGAIETDGTVTITIKKDEY